ncbi:UbiX family flavin prenyltransferase [Calderihabitans maritimus]|uniref:Flavin prenyltransferase UbiX n=1 Tax=Calderihabitans maritimus TaxID=1246530 RepID=A0A1Z5HQU5_9FIRM|nr:flavin prenyltransferase UbiX [Calderihabitans maritimus]GAW91884.1 aromatic acid decarboxylase [Calderihabitans maritimus]
MKRYIVAITGASGSIYGCRMLQVLKEAGCFLYVTVSKPGRQVLKEEMGWVLEGRAEVVEERLREYLGYSSGDPALRYFDPEDLGAVIASGSAQNDGMIVIPCTMSTVSAIAHGTAGNLIERAADVMLKEGRPLVVVPRETPLNQVHLENMLKLARMGVHVVPAMPAFYHHPQTINDLVDFIVGRVLDLLGVEHHLYSRWGE